MKKPRVYATPAAFKRALEDRLREEAKRTGSSLVRLRQIVVFERLLGRLNVAFGSSVIAKGGVALELRLARARSTRDLDLRLSGAAKDTLERIREAANEDLGDYLTYEIREQAGDRGIIDGEGAVYDGLRFRTEARIAGALYGMPFGLDVAFGDVLTGEVDEIEGTRVFDFVGAPRPKIRLYPKETHLAEKLHAYTLPRERENSRVKDLPDIALLAQAAAYDAKQLHRAFVKTFEFRKTHALPERLTEPPSSWTIPYAKMAKENALPWADILSVYEAARAFVDPVLVSPRGTWDSARWLWSTET